MAVVIDRIGRRESIAARGTDRLQVKQTVDRRGNQWADWVLSGCSLGPRESGGWSIARMMGGSGGGTVNEVGGALEWEFDKAVAKLPEPLIRVVKAHYISWMGKDQRDFVAMTAPLQSVQAKAEACDMKVATFYRKLDIARTALFVVLTTPQQPCFLGRVLKP